MTLYEKLNGYIRGLATEQKVKIDECVIPVPTCMAWYKQSDGLRSDQRIYPFPDGQGIKVMLANAQREWSQTIKKENRLEVMQAEQVDPSFRARAEQSMGSSELSYIYDVAQVQSGYWLCAVPLSFMVELMGVRETLFAEDSDLGLA